MNQTPMSWLVEAGPTEAMEKIRSQPNSPDVNAELLREVASNRALTIDEQETKLAWAEVAVQAGEVLMTRDTAGFHVEPAVVSMRARLIS